MREFHYRLARRASGGRPGSHRGSSFGPGQEFIAHQRLYDHPDARRLDLRASLANVRHEWLVRATRQRASIRIQVIVDVSASMTAGAGGSKLAVAAEFLEALGQSAFRAGDAVGMLAFDARLRTELCVPALRGRGTGQLLAGLVREVRGTAGDGTALRAVGARIAARTPLVFLVSDFHWPLHPLRPLLDALTGSLLVPVVLWTQEELQPPARNGLARLRDVESGQEHSVWVRARLRARWERALRSRREELEQIFGSRGIRPFHVSGAFSSAALSRYFLELAG